MPRGLALGFLLIPFLAAAECGTDAELFDATPPRGDGGVAVDAQTGVDTTTGVDAATGADAWRPDTNVPTDAWRPDTYVPTDAARPDSWRPDTNVATDAGSMDSGIARPDAGGVEGEELNPGWIGGACGSSGECTNPAPICVTDGFPGGMCSEVCGVGGTGSYICPDTEYGPETLNTITRCVTAASGEPRCVGECDFSKSDTGCRPGYVCVLRQRHGDTSRIFPVCLPEASQGWPGDTAPAFDIGDDCLGADDCNQLACLGIPGGYCTKLMCEFAGCPDGSSCFEIEGLDQTACLEDCSSDGECRQDDGHACDDDAEVCWPEPRAPDCLIPDEPGFNHYTIAAMNDWMRFPKDSTYPFCWLSSSCGSTWGMIHNGEYANETVFPGGGDCFCTGHTLEIFLDAWRRYREDHGLGESAIFGGLTMSELDLGMFYQHWQGSGSAPYASSAAAFESVGIGQVLGEGEWENVRAGDFMNLSRDPASGHAIIFINWERDLSGQIIGLRYYGCNPGMGDSCPDPSDPANEPYQSGPGFITEYFYGHGGDVLPQYLFIGRVLEP